jgi:hypothetical protein
MARPATGEIRAGLLDMLSNDAPGNRDKAFHYLVEKYTGQAGLSGYPLRLMADRAGNQICVEKEPLMT